MFSEFSFAFLVEGEVLRHTRVRPHLVHHRDHRCFCNFFLLYVNGEERGQVKFAKLPDLVEKMNDLAQEVKI